MISFVWRTKIICKLLKKIKENFNNKQKIIFLKVSIAFNTNLNNKIIFIENSSSKNSSFRYLFIKK